MSRCYPFPPPGYVPTEIRDEPMIESSSIKGAKEEVERVKKDSKNKKDKKRKERENESDRSKTHRHKRRRKDEKVGDGCELIMNSEKSCLTVEELEHQSTSQNSCDSTLHSSNETPQKQIQSQSQTLDCRHYDSDSGIRFLLPTKEKKTVSKEKMSSSLSTHHPKQEKPSSSSHHQQTNGSSKLCRKCPPSTAVRFLNLIENWSPDLVESKLTDSEDQELWLFVKFGAERHHRVSNQTTIKEISSMVWPTARFLPEVELHALPFTVPF